MAARKKTEIEKRFNRELRTLTEEFGGRMLLIYFGAAITSDMVSSLFGLGGIGASGAIAGLIAVGTLLRPLYITHLIGGIPLPLFLVGWLALLADVTGVLIPQETQVNHYAHLGGYMFTMILLYFSSRRRREQMALGFVLNIALLIIFFVVQQLF